MSLRCPGHVAGYGALSSRLRSKASAGRIPVNGSIELTSRCNLGCEHCYISDPRRVGASPAIELTTERLLEIFDQLAAAGCLWLGITGGEPLVRPDFPALYRYARRRGFLITLLTNGTLINDRIADLLADFPPLMVEITLYGASAPIHERVTGVAGSHERCLRGIDRLLERGVALRLKSTVTSVNAPELPGMRDHAARRGLDFRWDALLNSRVDGRTLPAGLGLSPSKIVDLEAADEPVRAAWEKRRSHQLEASAVEQTFACAAGVSAFHVDSTGLLMPCLLARRPAFDLKRGAFSEGWNGPIREAVRAWMLAESRCRECSSAPACEICPGWGLIEHDDPAAPVELLCKVADRRDRVLFGNRDVRGRPAA